MAFGGPNSDLEILESQQVFKSISELYWWFKKCNICASVWLPIGCIMNEKCIQRETEIL